MRRSGVRIPLPPVFARVVEESEDCRAVALAKADIFYLATSTRRATTRQASYLLRSRRRRERRLSRRSLGEGGHFLPCHINAASYDSASQMKKRFTYVYILQSEIDFGRYYIGLARDLRDRLRRHNAGHILHTNKWKPWRIKTYVALSDSRRAVALERYLKSSSGRAFTKKRL